MTPLMTIRIAAEALTTNKMRTGLTMLGMIIGVSAVITLVAMGSGAQATISDQIKGAGTNMITVNAGNFTSGGVRLGSGAASSLTVDDAAALRDIDGVQYLAAGASSRAQVIAGNANWYTRITGTDVDLLSIRAWALRSGTFFGDDEVRDAAKVAVLGSSVSQQLFGGTTDPTGQLIRIGSQPFRVLGVMASKGQGMGEDMDDQILVPYTTVQKKLAGITHLQSIVISAASAEETSAVADRIAIALRARHNIERAQDDDFTIRTLEEIADVRSQALGTMTTLLAGIAAVSLVVGGIGIMNIMLVSVTERTREIGLRMALGARKRDVLMQFLAESVGLSLAGGGIGVALGFAIAEGLSRWMSWRTDVSLESVALAFGFAAATGVFFGFYPARKAAGLHPIEALRFE